MVRRYLPKSTEELIQWYERFISPLSLLVGFVLDNLFFLKRVDLWTANALLFGYLSLAAGGILLFNLVETGRLRGRPFVALAPFLPVATQFAFGGLFSAYVSLYSRSAAFAVSWIFVLALAVLTLGNERFRKYYVRFGFQMAVLYTVLLSFLIFYLPVVFKSIGTGMFLTACAVSLGAIALFVRLLGFLMPELVRRERMGVARSVALICITFNVLYFSNAIPPLPLALKEAGVYHGVSREGDEYRLLYEPLPWYAQYLRYNTVFHRAVGEPVYVFTSVFAPTDLKTDIVHEWQRYDATSDEWVTESTLVFPIRGGRDGGYRGYSLKSDIADGPWRVNVKTASGKLIGRVSFRVESSVGQATLVEKVR